MQLGITEEEWKEYEDAMAQLHKDQRASAADTACDSLHAEAGDRNIDHDRHDNIAKDGKEFHSMPKEIGMRCRADTSMETRHRRIDTGPILSEDVFRSDPKGMKNEVQQTSQSSEQGTKTGKQPRKIQGPEKEGIKEEEKGSTKGPEIGREKRPATSGNRQWPWPV
ncbi:hypothetical protein ONS95_011686 [Cadophora gregata]|uniref:uncharacterized protein n=1 Tax=Cadophora gregata TaxID=51156 RepID=UPI0026DC940D|nr:uncharacterized protein ONS95_011686 [Cadophora gregata]KAK0120279.1 hypothetical protein ONS95_011686 [Cadophora gregata]KAK0121312.1 hypothetical protein ONS96_011488 [Cadophora gregata f. sp. sojae]